MDSEKKGREVDFTTSIFKFGNRIYRQFVRISTGSDPVTFSLINLYPIVKVDGLVN